MNFLKNLVDTTKNQSERLMLATFASASIVALYVSTFLQYSFIYDDSVSYLNIPRLVVDNAQIGVEQIGSIWLPMNHLLKLPFIWNDTAYQSGFAGSIISMVSYVVASVFIYKLAQKMTRSRLASAVAGLTFALNPNWLYLQSTPMSESLFMAFFTMSAYAFYSYTLKREVSWLVALSLINALMLTTRYEGWFVVLVQALMIVLLYAPSVNKRIDELVTRMLIFTIPTVIIAGLWLLWNYQVTGNMFYFLNGELSASAFTERQQQSGVVAAGNIQSSLYLFGSAAVSMVGLIPLALASTGFMSWLWRIEASTRQLLDKASSTVLNRTRTFSINAKIRNYLTYKSIAKAAMIFVLLSPAIFHVCSLYFGFSSVKVAGFAQDTVSLNLRYAIFLLPFAALGIVQIVKNRLYYLLILLTVLTTYATMMLNTPAIIADGLEGKIDYQTAASVLEEQTDDNDVILMSFATNSPLAFYSNLDLDTYVHEGAYEPWQQSLEAPAEDVTWVVVSEKFDFDPIHVAINNDPQYLQGFQLVYSDIDTSIYERIGQ